MTSIGVIRFRNAISQLENSEPLNNRECQRSYLKSYIKKSLASQYLGNKKKIKSVPVFTFNHITKEDVVKEIKKLRCLTSITRR